MRMAEDAHFGLNTFEKSAALFRQLPTLIHNMTDGDAEAGQFDHGFWWKATLLVSIDIAGHRRHGSNGLKLLDDQLSTDIAGAERMVIKRTASFVLRAPVGSQAHEEAGLTSTIRTLRARPPRADAHLSTPALGRTGGEH